MKKLFILLFSFFILGACLGNSQSVEDAKKQMLEPEQTVESNTNTGDDISSDQEDKVSSNTGSDFITIESLDDTSLLSFDTLLDTDIQDGEVEISGSTLGNVDKITVSFTNPDSDYPDDLYTLKTFKSGGNSFKYLASSRFKVLDFGTNTYVFTAYSGKETTRERITIQFEEKQQTPVTETEKLIGTEVSAELTTLPTGGSYGNPVMLGEDAFTYSDINGLEVKKLDVSSINCEDLTDYLSDNINTWFYWNTCRDLIKDKAITFYVLKLESEQYLYQKHYVDFIHGFYGTYDIETGIGVTSENIAEKNSELKEINDTFANTTLVDDLFKDIVN